MTRHETRLIVGEYIRATGRENPFTEDLPGYDWLDGFMKRHKKELTVRQPEQLKVTTVRSSANQVIFNAWFELLHTTLIENDLLDKPERIYNVDESGFPLDPKRLKVIAEKGAQNLFRIIGGSGRENITVQGCAKADGLMLPPYVLYAAKNLCGKWTEDGPEGARYNVSEKGWMDSACFHDWFLKMFVPSLPPERPVLLIFDGHASHMNRSTIQEAARENIITLKLPSNSTHALQPLDVGVYGPVKAAWERILVMFARQNLGTPLIKELFPSLLKQLWQTDSMSSENIKAGFKRCGIMPWDPTAIPTDIYYSAQLFDRPAPPANTPQPGPSTDPLTPPQPGPSTDPLTPPQPGPSTDPLTPLQPGPSTDQLTSPQPGPSTDPLTSPQPGPSTDPLTSPQPGPSTDPLTPPQPGPSTDPLTSPQPGPSTDPLTSPQPGPSTDPLTPPQPGPSTDPLTSPQPGPSTDPLTSPQPGPSTDPLTSPQPGPSTDSLTTLHSGLSTDQDQMTLKDFFIKKLTPLVARPKSNGNREKAIKRQYGESLTSAECLERLQKEEEEKAAKKKKTGNRKPRGKKAINETEQPHLESVEHENLHPEVLDDLEQEEAQTAEVLENFELDADTYQDQDPGRESLDDDSDGDPDWIPARNPVNRNLWDSFQFMCD